MSGRRRRVPDPRTSVGRRGLLLGAGIVVAGGAAAAAVTLWPAGDGGGGGGTRASGSASAGAGSPSVSPSPSRSYPLSKPPRTIPAVRAHTAAHGPGWRPASGARVVVDDDALADEGKLLAGELRMTYGGRNGARAGDVELALGGSGGAESYTLTVGDGRVRIAGPGQSGVFYGTRTLKQEVRDGGTAPEGVVRDGPAKPVRGFMLDIARKHFTADWIEDRVRELGDLKYNEIGLHFSDDQGFRIASDTHPEVVSKEHLTKAEVRRIVDLAASRRHRRRPRDRLPGSPGRGHRRPPRPAAAQRGGRVGEPGHARHLQAGLPRRSSTSCWGSTRTSSPAPTGIWAATSTRR